MELNIDNPLVKTFVDGAGGKNSVITILPTASDFAKEIGERYLELFQQLSSDVRYYCIEKRKQAEDPQLMERLEHSTGLFFTGGNQLKITSLLGGSNFLAKLKQVRERGIFIAGTSAGASAMSSTMIAGGKSDVMYKGSVELSPGLGFITNAVIDSHFIKRGRITRLLNVVSLNPGTVGLGLSEDTGILMHANNSMIRVIGSRQVIIVDGRKISHSNIATIEVNMPFSVTDVRVHVLGHDYGYDLSSHEVYIPHSLSESSPAYDPKTVSHNMKKLEYRDW